MTLKRIIAAATAAVLVSGAFAAWRIRREALAEQEDQ